mgnify:CR=1 FL=1
MTWWLTATATATKQLRPVTADTRGMLSFQRLDVYGCAIEFVALAVATAAQIPRGSADLRDQLRRAAFSVPLNIAEAAGRASEADAARHYAIARGSAMECAAVLDILRTIGSIQELQHRQATDLLARVVAMLTKLCR